MYFQIENTPENIRRARKAAVVQQASPKEEVPRLVVAPFSRPPQVVFENVVIGTSCERDLEVFNPSKQSQQITLGRALPEGLFIELPGEWLLLEPETCYTVSMVWSPKQPTALRETIRFTNEQRGRYDIVVLLKTAMNVKGKIPPKGFKISPGKMKKKGNNKKTSPVAIYKRKAEVIYNTTVKQKYNVVQTSIQKTCKILKQSDKENYQSGMYDNPQEKDLCPFDSHNSINFNFDTSEVFSSIKQKDNDVLQSTYEKPFSTNPKTLGLHNPKNVLKPSNRRASSDPEDVFDNFTFTPLKCLPSKSNKLDQGPKIVLSLNSDTEIDDSLDTKADGPHSIMYITSAQSTNKWLTVENEKNVEVLETPYNKKIPNTSSPKELSSPNFTINTEFSRISDLSFMPQRFSTERKAVARHDHTHDVIDDGKISSDTFTKESPLEARRRHEPRPTHVIQQPKVCRQSLFKEQNVREYERNYLRLNYESESWQNELRADVRSPPRELTPPMQSIPEESAQQDTLAWDRSQQHTFTINRTFEHSGRPSAARQSWSKKSVKPEFDLWKVPVQPRKSLKPRPSKVSKDVSVNSCANTTYDSCRSAQNVTLNQIGNVYSQASTVDPFLSSTYFYDEECVERFEGEFKRWLNCILTPPADLESNIEQKIDVGKAWLETRNKDVPLAPTKEQVSSKYHDSHRLERLRRSARALFLSQEMVQVFLKLNAQIEKKLIAVRADRNLHLDVGLQKVIMELLLSYNPLWLRIGLEAIYGQVLPLKSNSDIDGLTTFIIQRMFKNPHLKNKHSKSSAPNMLLPAYMEAIKKFTLKKFFALVYFLDQAKQRRLIAHDPCLFCRNAVCKESRELVIRFTRELIAGIGDITKHLRPLGYVVCHKQSYLDEYKYAVHNIAVDLRDGVRITKVMEIILMKSGLMTQLRTPAISRLQKIHNVQVALTALKEANFAIVGEIASSDVADGHREKTLSLLWQLIHVFRAPLFEKAANVIQTWWKRKYAVIAAERREAERARQLREDAASAIQCWWRRIQYGRWVEAQMKELTAATIVVQKYFRMWLCRSRLLKLKRSVLIVERWYERVKLVRAAKASLLRLRTEREELRRKSATKIQTHVRRWICVRNYTVALQRIVVVQSLIRAYIVRKWHITLKKAATVIQQRYRAKLLMREQMRKFAEQKNSAIVLQSFYRMFVQRRIYFAIKNAVKMTEDHYEALVKMRNERYKYLQARQRVILIQSVFRGKVARKSYANQRKAIVNIQRRIRANNMMKRERENYQTLRKSTILIQQYVRGFFETKKLRQEFLDKVKAARVIQLFFSSFIAMKAQKKEYLSLKNSAIVLQRHFRRLLQMKKERQAYLNLKEATINIQRRFRATQAMKRCRYDYKNLQQACVSVQQKYKALLAMRQTRAQYLKQKSACIKIQTSYRAFKLGQQKRKEYMQTKSATVTIQQWYRRYKLGKKTQGEYRRTTNACVTIQRVYKAYILGKKQRHEFLRIKTATVCIQKYFRLYVEMKTVREQYVQLKMATVTIQRLYRARVVGIKQRAAYHKVLNATRLIQSYYRSYKETVRTRQRYTQMRNAALCIQRRYRSLCLMRRDRQYYMKLVHSTQTIQKIYRATLAMRMQRAEYLKLRASATAMQNRFRANILMKTQRDAYSLMRKSCVSIQMFYRAHVLRNKLRSEFLTLKRNTITIQQRYRANVSARKEQKRYLQLRAAAIAIQKRYRANILMRRERAAYRTVVKACGTIQQRFRARVAGKKQLQGYTKLKNAAVLIQERYRLIRETRRIHSEYTKMRQTIIYTQRRFRCNKAIRDTRRNKAALKIQAWYRALKVGNQCRQEYLAVRQKVILIQSVFRMYVTKKQYVAKRIATITIQTHYRAYILGRSVRRDYTRTRHLITKIQANTRRSLQRKRYLQLKAATTFIQRTYRHILQQIQESIRRNEAAVHIQKVVRGYLARTYFQRYRRQVVFVQRQWRGKAMTRLVRGEFERYRRCAIRLQAWTRGLLVRRALAKMRALLAAANEERRKHKAACTIQAWFRGHSARCRGSERAAALRRRWRAGALRSTQESLRERNEEAMEVLSNMYDIETVIRAFRSLELLTEVFPMMYNGNASLVARRVFIYMSVTNRSVSSVEVLKSAAAVLASLARYRATGPAVYARDRVRPVLKFMWRFSNSETGLFCILCTYLWLFHKYDAARKDLTEYLHVPENLKMLVSIRGNVDRMKRMTDNAVKHKYSTLQPHRFTSHTGNHSMRDSQTTVLPALDPDYGIKRHNKPRYFEDASQAINCLFRTYDLCSSS